MKTTPLNNLHKELGAKLVEFAGYEMPIQYSDGIMTEHNWTRENAGLFDVSHMGQAMLEGDGALAFVESITPTPFTKTPLNKAKYTVLLNDNNGIIDDLIITKLADDKFFFVYNAGCRAKDEAHIESKLPSNLTFTKFPDRALIALQGKDSANILTGIFPDADFANQEYMSFQQVDNIFVSRLGYTGEDGFEISVPKDEAESLSKKILANDNAKPIGLGARDSLRLEMGYPLYGHDINDDTTPLNANLQWVVAKAKRESFQSPDRLRVGVEILDKGIAREGAKIFSVDGDEIGVITSGGFSPTLQKAIAQGYVKSEYSENGTDILIDLRGRKIAAKTHELNFIEPKTHKNK